MPCKQGVTGSSPVSGSRKGPPLARLTKAKERARLRSLGPRAEAEVHRARAAIGSIRCLAVTRSYLGITAKQLQQQRRSGKSLADVANARTGKSAAGLIDALVGARKADLAAAVAAKTLGGGEKSHLLSRLRDRASKQVDRRPPGHG